MANTGIKQTNDVTLIDRVRGFGSTWAWVAQRLWMPALGAWGATVLCGALVAAPVLAAPSAVPADATVVEVKAGDTFSGIAGRYVGGARNWKKLYRSDLSGLPNPNVLAVGMRLELASDSTGARFLRLLPTAEKGSMASAARPAAPSAASPSNAAALPAMPVAAAPAPTPAPASVPALDAAASDELVLGVLPNIGAPALMAQYDHLKRYLARTDGQRVRVVVAPNFKEFFDATMRGDYDLAVAAPHFARVAQLDRNMIPLVSYQPRINALLIAPIDSTISGARGLRERTVAFANPQSLVAMYGQQWLRQQGLEAGTDYAVKGARTDIGVGRMLLLGDAAAAIMSNGEFRSLPADESARLKIVEVFARIPNFIIVAHPRVERTRLARLRNQLKGFLADNEDGVPFAQATGFNAMADVDDAQLRELDSFAAQTRRAMGVGN
jgi:phosphonate transport system substrate-binding protein